MAISAGLVIALVCAILAIVYGIWSIGWIMAKPAGNARMQEIAAAIQAGAKAYLNRQYTTIGIVGVILFVDHRRAAAAGTRRRASRSARSSPGSPATSA